MISDYLDMIYLDKMLQQCGIDIVVWYMMGEAKSMLIVYY